MVRTEQWRRALYSFNLPVYFQKMKIICPIIIYSLLASNCTCRDVYLYSYRFLFLQLFFFYIYFIFFHQNQFSFVLVQWDLQDFWPLIPVTGFSSSTSHCWVAAPKGRTATNKRQGTVTLKYKNSSCIKIKLRKLCNACVWVNGKITSVFIFNHIRLWLQFENIWDFKLKIGVVLCLLPWRIVL